MNIILFSNHERNNNTITLTGRQATHIKKILRACPGDKLKIGQINGPRYEADVVTIENDQAILHISKQLTPEKIAHQTDLILAMPRPIMLKRILSQIATFGVGRLFIIRSNRVEKSFLSASLLAKDNIHQRLLHGLEQGGHTTLPEIHIFQRFRPFAEDFLPTISNKYNNKLLAHPKVPHNLSQSYCYGQPNKTLLAIGPEGGWVDFEIETLQQQGLTPFHMGPRILRVDSAVPALLAQIDLLHEQAALK